MSTEKPTAPEGCRYDVGPHCYSGAGREQVLYMASSSQSSGTRPGVKVVGTNLGYLGTSSSRPTTGDPGDRHPDAGTLAIDTRERGPGARAIDRLVLRHTRPNPQGHRYTRLSDTLGFRWTWFPIH